LFNAGDNNDWPIESPQSNGIAEAFVKTFKRDYRKVNPRPDGASVLGWHGTRFEHYNTVRVPSLRDQIC